MENIKLYCLHNWGIDTENSLGRCQPQLSTKKTSLKPNFPIKKAFLAFQHRPALMEYCKLADKLNIYCKLGDKPNVWGVRHPLPQPLWLRPWSVSPSYREPHLTGTPANWDCLWGLPLGSPNYREYTICERQGYKIKRLTVLRK